MVNAKWLDVHGIVAQNKVKGTVSLDVQCQVALDVHGTVTQKRLKAQWLYVEILRIVAVKKLKAQWL
jgi:hypothetical protein